MDWKTWIERLGMSLDWFDWKTWYSFSFRKIGGLFCQQAFIMPLFCMRQTCFLQEFKSFLATLSEDCHIQEACGIFDSKWRSCTNTFSQQLAVFHYCWVFLLHVNQLWWYLVGLDKSGMIDYWGVEVFTALSCKKPKMLLPCWWNCYSECREELFVMCLVWRAVIPSFCVC